MNLPTVQFGILNLDLSRIVQGIIVLSLNSGAYISESVRAGIESIPKGQIEAIPHWYPSMEYHALCGLASSY